MLYEALFILSLILNFDYFFPDDDVILKSYESTFTGYLQSWLDRFPKDDILDDVLEEIWENDKKYFADLLE